MRLKPIFLCLASLAVVLSLLACNRSSPRSDAQVATEVQGAIARDAKVTSREVVVQAEHGMITLSGDVSSDEERSAAAVDAATVEGVRTVVNNLVVEPEQVAAAPTEAKPADSSQAPGRSKKLIRPADSGYLAGQGLPKADATNTVAPAANPASAPTEMAAAPTAPTPPPAPKKVTIPAGTQITVRLNDGLDTERNQVGDQFHATLGTPIVIDGDTVIPSGAEIVGRVVDVKSAGRFAGNSALTLELNSLATNGKTYNVQSNQWSRQGKGEGKNTAVKAGGGAAVGAIIGGLAGGGKGAAIGSVAGAGAGTGVAATKKGEQIKLAPESSLSFLLINSLTVTQPAANSRETLRAPSQ